MKYSRGRSHPVRPRRRTSSSSAWPSAMSTGSRKTSPSCPASCAGPSPTASPSTPRPSTASAARCAPTCCLRPDPSTLVAAALAAGARARWCRMFCDITYPDGTPFEADTRRILQAGRGRGRGPGLRVHFRRGDGVLPVPDSTKTASPPSSPYDNAGYMDIAPEDKGENVRREICLTLEQMGIQPESSHHEERPGPERDRLPLLRPPHRRGQRRHVPHRGADRWPRSSGLCADFSPKPLPRPGRQRDAHQYLRPRAAAGTDPLPQVIAGILEHIRRDDGFSSTPSEDSY